MSYRAYSHKIAPRPGGVSNSDASPSASDAPLTLRVFLESLKAHVATHHSAWVVAEVLSARTKGAVLYFELAESDLGGTRCASAQAKLWRDREMILGAFRAVAGEDPKPGMRLLVRLKATVHPTYGLSLDVEGIDPRFTLGDIEQRLQAMRQKLREAGLFDRNREEHACPDDFARVAVISPVGAAALGDFREAADRLERASLCRFDYHVAAFQGAGAADSLVAAMRAVVHAHKREPFCALCVIRGGGSVTDLADLNQFKIAHAICHVRMPVLTGIGHERDSVLLDDVASRRFDTPSKLILHIEQAIHASAQAAQADWLAVQNEARRRVERATREVESLRETVAVEGRGRATAEASEIAGDRQSVAGAARAALPRARTEADDQWRGIAADSQDRIAETRRALAADMQGIVGLGPRHTLARGFAVVRDASGRVVANRRTALEAATGDGLTVEFHDGSLPVRKGDCARP